MPLNPTVGTTLTPNKFGRWVKHNKNRKCTRPWVEISSTWSCVGGGEPRPVLVSERLSLSRTQNFPNLLLLLAQLVWNVLLPANQMISGQLSPNFMKESLNKVLIYAVSSLVSSEGHTFFLLISPTLQCFSLQADRTTGHSLRFHKVRKGNFY